MGRKMSIRNKIISNTNYLFFNWIIVTLMASLYWFAAGKTLLPKEYGIVSTSINLVILLAGISSLGLNATVGKLIPEYQSRRQEGKIKFLVIFSLKTVFLSNLIILSIILSLSSFLSHIFNIPLNVIWINAVILLIYSISLQFGFILFGFQNMKKMATTELFGQLAKVLFSIILILVGFRYFGLLIGFLIGAFLTFLLRFFSISFKGQVTKVSKKNIMLKYALPAFLSGLAFVFFFNGQYVLLNSMKGSEITGIFAISMILTSSLTTIPNILTIALLPTTSQLSIDNKTIKKRGYLIGLFFRYALFISLPLAIFLILFSRPIILLFSSANYLAATKLIPLLALGSLIYGTGNGFLNNLYAMGKTRINRNISIATTMLFFLLAVPLIYLFSAYGSVLAYISSVSFLSLLSFFYLRKFLKLKLPFKAVGKLFIACLISFTFLYIITRLISNLFIEIGFMFLAVILYIIILIPLRFYTKEDIFVLDFFAERLPIFKKHIIGLRNYLSRFV